jgi:toxin ParE1/3/4
MDLLAAAFEVLADSPKSAPACENIRQGYRRRNVERHMIYFRITGN